MQSRYLSTGHVHPHLGQSSCRHLWCRCISSRRQPVGPGLENAPLPHLLAVQKPQPLPRWCSPPWAEQRSLHLCAIRMLVTKKQCNRSRLVARSLILTVSASGVELLHGVVKADTDRSEAHLSLQACHQSIVQTPGPLCAHHGGDGAKHTPILQCTNPFGYLRLSLKLHDMMQIKEDLIWHLS